MARELPAEVKEKFQDYREEYRELIEGMNSRQEGLYSALIFLVKFSLLAAPFYIVLGTGWELEGLRAWNAHASAYILEIIGIDASSTGSFVLTGDMVLDVTWDSTAWKSAAVFIGLILASPGRLGAKMKGILLGIPILLGVNLLRISSMVYAVRVLGLDYEFIHTFLWRWGLTVAVLASWLLWWYRTDISRRIRKIGRL
ncbi:MAG: archaeosortase/exosortase family protein [Candidatus Nanohaloarchaeota archaeon QJJ-7]|nr:archaeosortase/exosortase family protein [Candidatus Nanohaloarchaeota archaeon QJJ-7]